MPVIIIFSVKAARYPKFSHHSAIKLLHLSAVQPFILHLLSICIYTHPRFDKKVFRYRFTIKKCRIFRPNYSEISFVSGMSATTLGLPHWEQISSVLVQPQEQTHSSLLFLLSLLLLLRSAHKDLIALFVNANNLSEIFPNNPNTQKKPEIG